MTTCASCSPASPERPAMLRSVLAVFLWASVACSSSDSSAVPARRADASTTDGGALCTSCGACVESFIIDSMVHQGGDLTYADPPPTGGPHNECWTTWGVHDEQVGD